MKRNRIIYVSLWVLSLVGISFFGGTVSYGFFTLLTLLPLVSFFYLLLVYFLFHIYQRIDVRVLTVNQPVTFHFTLANEYFLTFAGVRVRFYSDFSAVSGLDDETEYELLPKTEIKKETVLVCRYRGEYEVGIRQVETTDYFGLIRFSYRLPEKLRVLVKPQFVVLDNMRHIDINQVMRETKKNTSMPDALARPYVPGDDIRQIHWGLSAKCGEWMTREKIEEEKQGIGIVLETKRCSNDPKVFLPVENKMLELVLAIAYFLAGKGVMTCEYHYNGTLCENRAERLQQLDGFYEAISAIEFRADNTQQRLFPALAEHRGVFGLQAVFFVVCEWGEGLRQTIGELAERNVYVIVYLVGAKKEKQELSMDLRRGQLVFVDPDADIREVL